MPDGFLTKAVRSANGFFRDEREGPAGRDLPEKESGVQRSERLFEHYRQAQKPWQEEAARYVMLRHNSPFTDAEKEEIEAMGLAPISTPLLHQILKQYVAMLAARNPRFMAVPREDSDVETAKAISDLFAYVWYVSRGDRRLKRVIEDDYVQGRGVFFAYVDGSADRGKGEVFITTLDPQEVYPDPNAREPDWSDAAAILVVRLVTEEQYLDQFPGSTLFHKNRKRRPQPAEDDDFHFDRTGENQQRYRSNIQDLEHTHYRLIERYEKVRRTRHLAREDHGGGRLVERDLSADELEAYREEAAFIVDLGAERRVALADEELLFFAARYAEAGGDGTSPEIVFLPLGDGRAQAAVVTPTTKAALIDEEVIELTSYDTRRVQVHTSLGGVKEHDYELDTEHYPIVPLMSEHQGHPYPMSDAAQVAPKIEEYNNLTQKILAWVHSMAGPKYEIQPQALSDEDQFELVRPGPGVIENRGERPLAPMTPPPMPAGLLAERQQLKAEVYDASGLYPWQQGAAQDTPETVRGSILVQENSLQRIKSKSDALGYSLSQLGRVVFDLARGVYTHHKVLAVVNPDAPAAINVPLYDDLSGAVTAIARDVTTGDYDVVFVGGSTLPRSREREAEQYERTLGILANLGPQYAEAFLPHYLKKLEIPNLEGFLEEASGLAQRDQLIAQMQEEIKRLSGDMQTAERELRHADRQVEKEKFKSALKGVEASVKKDAELARDRLSDETSARADLARRIDEIFQTAPAEA